MSSTEIYAFDKNGYAYLAGETHNGWRGAMAIWSYLEEKYLPLFIPSYVKDMAWYKNGMSYDDIVAMMHFTPTRTSSMHGTPNPMNEIWDLYKRDDVSIDDKIVLYTTYDNCLIKHEDIPRVVEAFLKFGADSSLPEQAKILNELYKSDNCIAVGWNQTSITATHWGNRNTIDDEELPYNCLKQSDHFWLFEDINEV